MPLAMTASSMRCHVLIHMRENGHACDAFVGHLYAAVNRHIGSGGGIRIPMVAEYSPLVADIMAINPTRRR
jgi:hypothetical protein